WDLAFVVPTGTAAGNHVITLTDAAGNTANGTLRVYAPTLTLATSTGPVGTLFTPTITGWVPNDSVQVSFGGTKTCTITTDANGTGTGSGCYAQAMAYGPHPVTVASTSYPTVSATPASFSITPSSSADRYTLAGMAINVSGSG